MILGDLLTLPGLLVLCSSSLFCLSRQVLWHGASLVGLWIAPAVRRLSEPGLMKMTIDRVMRSSSGGFSHVLMAAQGSPFLGVGPQPRVSPSPCISLVEN